MRSIAVVCVLVAALGCGGTGGGASTASTPERVQIASGTSSSTTASMNPTAAVSIGEVVAAPPDRVFGVLRAVYDSIGIAPTTIDQSRRTIGNPNARIRRQLKGVQMSRYLDCGKTQSFPSADTYEVTMSITTSAQPNGSGGTMVSTIIESSARPITFSGDPVRCLSLSTLEKRIATLASTLVK
jgi:hypothetical protein